MSPSPHSSPVARPEKGDAQPEAAGQEPADATLFMRMFGATQLIFVVCFFLFVDYNDDSGLGMGSVNTSYKYYTDVAMMILIGFGFLMTFLAKYAHSSLGYTFMLTAMTIQYSILAQGFFGHLHAGDLFDGDIAKCVETATVSVEADFDACAAVTALDDAAACAAVMGSVDDSVAVCTYHPKIGVEENCVATVHGECVLAAGVDCSVEQTHCTYTTADAANGVEESCAATEHDECTLTAGVDCSIEQTHCTYTAPIDSPKPIIIDVTNLIHALFAAGAVMISFGAVLGRTSPSQLMVMTFFAVTCFHFNEWIGAGELKAIDMGGSMFVHTFGAYFGLACSMMLHRGADSEEVKKDNSSRYDSDVTAMLGTIVLWILWPSFNGALAPTPDSQMRVVINTVLALTSSATFAFMMSHMVDRGRFNMVHIQNATLAGGVAIGSSSDLVVGPGGAIFIGSIAGMLSVVGYHHIQPMLHEKLGLHDTCGVHNLHGLPGLLGGLGGAISCAMASPTVYGADFGDLFSEGRTPETQWPFQVWALLVTLAFAICGGSVCGMLMRMLGNAPAKPFRDDAHWTVEGGLPAP